ncbi:MAG: hypothetical protein WDZ49_10080, partial [Litorilinea sp.]
MGARVWRAGWATLVHALAIAGMVLLPTTPAAWAMGDRTELPTIDAPDALGDSSAELGFERYFVPAWENP